MQRRDRIRFPPHRPGAGLLAALATAVLAACGSAAHAGETSAPVAVGAAGPSHFPSAAPGSGRLVDVSAGGGYEVYLPPGYTGAARKGARFPVLYLLHGDGNGPRHT